MALKQVVWVDVSPLSTIFRLSSKSLLLSPHSCFGFSLCMFEMFYENALEYFFFWELRLPGDCLSTWGRRKQLDVSLTKGPRCFSQGWSHQHPPGSTRRDISVLLPQDPSLLLVQGKSQYKAPGRVKSAGSAWRFFKSCKQAFFYFWKVQIHRNKEVADCTERL